MFEARETESPYPGLRPFEPHETEIFFGREAHTDRLLEILQRERFLAVIGPSGCGKSSLVRAGMLPALAAGWLGTGSLWRIAIMRPGHRPLRRLAETLLQPSALAAELQSASAESGRAESASDVALIEAELRRGPLGLLELTRDARRGSSESQPSNLLVLVDQFEEVFTYAASGDAQSDESVAFVNLLLAHRALADGGIYVALTMRSDFLGHCMRFLDLPEAINRAQYLTPRLARSELKEAIGAPARVFGGEVEETLVGELINAVADDPDQLPILQHALARMWHSAQQRNLQAPVIARTDFEEIGGIEGALSAHANAVLAELPPEQQALVEMLFRCITERTGAEAGGREIRRPQRLERIAAWCGRDWQEFVPIIEAFAREGVSFLSFGPVLNRDSVIDLSHEALIRQWQKLQGWVASEAKRAVSYRRWLERSRERAAGGELLHGTDLALAREWRDGAGDWHPSAQWAARYATKQGEAAKQEFSSTLTFIAESEARGQAEQEAAEAAERERIAAKQQRLLAEKEAAEARAQAEGEKAEAAVRERAQAQAHARKSRRQAVFAAVAAIIAFGFAALAGGLWLDATESRKTAVAKAHEALVRQLMSEASFYADKDPDRGQLLAVEAYRQAPSPVTETLLRQIYVGQEGLKFTLQGHRGGINSAGFSPDGKTLLTASSDSTARLWDAATARLLATLEGHEASIGATFSPDGRTVVTASIDNTARLWEAASGKLLHTLKGHDDWVTNAAFSPDGKLVVTAGGSFLQSKDNTPRLWEVATGRQVGRLVGHKDRVNSIAFSPDGKTLATASGSVLKSKDNTARLWDAASGMPLATLEGHNDMVTRVAFSPDGKAVVTASEDGTARLWETASGKPLVALEGHKAAVNYATFSPDGGTLVTVSGSPLGSQDNTARIWDVASGKALAVLEGHKGFVTTANFSPDGQSLVTAGTDGTVRLWEVGRAKLLATLAAHKTAVNRAVFSADGSTVMTASADGTARLWDPAISKPLFILEGHKDVVQQAAFSPDGKTVVTASGRLLDSKDNTARLWEVASGKLLTTWEGHRAAVLQSTFSPDGKTVLTASFDATARLWEVTSGKLMTTLEGHKGPVFRAAFSPDGQTIVTASFDGTARLWEAASGKPLATLTGHKSGVLQAAFSPDGKMVGTASVDATARLWESGSGKPIATLEGHKEQVIHVAFSPDGRTVLTAGGGMVDSKDNTARLWDATSGKTVAILEGHKDLVNYAAFSPDGRTVVTASFDLTARLWEAPSGKALATLEGHSLQVIHATFSPDGRTVVTASFDGTARLWEVASGKPLATLQGHEGALIYATFSPDGSMVATTGVDGTARLWRCGVCRPAEALIADMLSRVGRDLTDEERAHSGLPAKSRVIAQSAVKPNAPERRQ